MTPIQCTIFSIIEDIAERYERFDDFIDDRFYRAWVKHFEHQKGAHKKMRKLFDEREECRQMQLSLIPKYF